MSLNETPRGDRIHIGIFGRRNAGKSSLINALTGQELAIVSEEAGTTTDPVTKAMELHPIGPVVFIDTAGLDDEGDLGDLRVEKTAQMIGKTDIAILVIDGEMLTTDTDPSDSEATKDGTDEEMFPCLKDGFELEKQWFEKLRDDRIPTVIVINKWDAFSVSEGDAESASQGKATDAVVCALGIDETSTPLCVSASTGNGIDELRQMIVEAARQAGGSDDDGFEGLPENALVLLVMPQDIQAPKGRLILPQVQTIRTLLDRKCRAVSTTSDGYESALKDLARTPDLIITDSQCFRQVAAGKPEDAKLTSFSILMARAKGDIETFVAGAKAIDDLAAGAGETADAGTAAGAGETAEAEIAAGAPRILIAEACTHVPQGEDIGTVKIPRLLREHFGEDIEIVNVRGNDFPDAEELKGFDLIIHCGACMFNRRHVMTRIAAAKEAGVPITNYGVFLARMTGILDQVSW